jgi:hypothetical protein
VEFEMDAAGNIFALASDGSVLERRFGDFKRHDSPRRIQANDLWIQDGVTYIVGDGRAMLRFDGENWEVIDLPGGDEAVSLEDIWGDGEEMWVVGGEGVGTPAYVAHMSAGNWESVDPPACVTPSTCSVRAITQWNGSIIVGTDHGDLFRREESGWVPLPPSPPDLAYARRLVTAYGKLHAASNQDTVLAVFDGSTWTHYDTPDGHRIADMARGTDGKLYVVTTQTAGAYIWNDGDWIDLDYSRGTLIAKSGNEILVAYRLGVARYDGSEFRTPGFDERVQGMAVVSDGTVLAATAQGNAYIYEDDGLVPIASLPAVDLRGVWGSSVDDFFVVGNVDNTQAGVLFHWDQGWQDETPAGVGVIPSIDGEGELICVADQGNDRVYCRENGVWTPQDLPGDVGSLYRIWIKDGVITVSGREGYVAQRRADQWIELRAPTTATLKALWGLSADNFLAGGNAGRLLRYQDGVWSHAVSGIPNDILHIVGSDPNDIFALADWGRIAHFNGRAWIPVDLGFNLSSIHAGAFDSSGRLFLGGSHVLGELVRAEPWRWRCSTTETLCEDGRDDDCDGKTDLADSDCLE